MSNFLERLNELHEALEELETEIYAAVRMGDREAEAALEVLLINKES